MNFHLHGIFGWWLSHLLSMCCLFAAGAAAIGGGEGGGAEIAGGGEGGAEIQGGGAGEFGEGGGEEDLGGQGEEELEGGGEETQRLTPQQRAQAAAEARLPANVKKLLGDLKTTDPKTAQLVRSAIFAQQAWQKVMPGGIRQAREMVQAFEEFGGAEGIRGMQEESQGFQEELQAIDDGWDNHPEEFISRMAQEDPDTFSRNIPIALEQLRKVDKDGYNFTLARIFYNTMNSANVINTLSQAWNLAQANKAAPGMAGVIEALSAIAEWANGIQQLAANQPERKPDRERERLNSERSRFEQDRFNAFKVDIGKKVRGQMESSIGVQFGKFLKLRGVDVNKLRTANPDQYKEMVAAADRRIADALNADKQWQKQKDRLLGSRDEARLLRFYQQKVDELLIDRNGQAGIARKVVNLFYKPGMARGGNRQQNTNGNNRQQQNSRQQNTNQGGGDNNQNRTVHLNGQPAGNLIDWSRTSDSMILDGQAYLKGKNELHKWR